MFRRLLGLAAESGQDLGNTLTSNVPTSSAPSSSSHTSTTDLFIIYMVIGFSVTFACILILMTVYHCCRRSCMPFIVVGPRTTHPLRLSSNRDSQPGHEPKQLFVVKHPGGDANLAFREDEELKPYKKKSRASLYSASLDDDEPFTIPAWKNDDSQGQQGNDTPQAAATISSMQPETSLDTTSSHVWHPDTDLQDDTTDASIPLHGHCSAARPSVADTASQTSPR